MPRIDRTDRAKSARNALSDPHSSVSRVLALVTNSPGIALRDVCDVCDITRNHLHVLVSRMRLAGLLAPVDPMTAGRLWLPDSERPADVTRPPRAPARRRIGPVTDEEAVRRAGLEPLP